MRLAFRSALPTLALLALATDAVAADYYVDVVNGDDANTGLAANDAFRTISHAMGSTTNSTATRVLVLPGTYSAATGEAFPIELGDRQLIGTEGSEETIIVGDPAQYVLSAHDEFRVEGLRLDTGSTGIFGRSAGSSAPLAVWEVHDVVIEDMVVSGIEFSGDTFGFDFCQGRLFDVHVTGCEYGLRWYHFAFDFYAQFDVVMEDCSMNGNDYGMQLFADGFPGLGNLVVRRCEFSNNSNYGLDATPYDEGEFVVVDSLFADNGGDGCAMSTAAASGTTGFEVLRNTFANNGGQYGLLAAGTTTGTNSQIAYNIARDNGVGVPGAVDTWVTATATASDNIVGTSAGLGLVIGSNGNVSVDPLFLDPAQGDYRLAGNSPAIDAIPGPPAGLDVLGLPRNVDGDLDAVTRSDYGAIEYRPLWCADEVQLGGTVVLELYSPAPGSSRVFGARATAIVPPTPTPFGDLYIHRVLHGSFGAVSTTPSQPGIVNVAISNQPWLLGHTLTFQALTLTNAGPSNWRLTNHREVLIVP